MANFWFHLFSLVGGVWGVFAYLRIKNHRETLLACLVAGGRARFIRAKSVEICLRKVSSIFSLRFECVGQPLKSIDSIRFNVKTFFDLIYSHPVYLIQLTWRDSTPHCIVYVVSKLDIKEQRYFEDHLAQGFHPQRVSFEIRCS